MVREFGRTGTAHIGADQFGSTTPTVYFGKGMGDLPIPALRPFAITGTLGYSIADKKLKATFDPDPSPSGVTGIPSRSFNNGLSNRWVGGLTLQYDLFYLKSQVRNFGLPDFVNKLTPLVEIAWSSPASKHRGPDPRQPRIGPERGRDRPASSGVRRPVPEQPRQTLVRGIALPAVSENASRGRDAERTRFALGTKSLTRIASATPDPWFN